MTSTFNGKKTYGLVYQFHKLNHRTTYTDVGKRESSRNVLTNTGKNGNILSQQLFGLKCPVASVIKRKKPLAKASRATG